MRYLLNGSLSGRISAHLAEPLADVTVRLYLDPEPRAEAHAPGVVVDRFGVLTAEEDRARESYLVAQARTDASGAFAVDFSERTVFGYRGWTEEYRGQPLELHVLVRTVDSRAQDLAQEPILFSLGRIVPDWQESDGARVARLEHELSTEQWNQLRARFDAWSIFGRVTDAADSPLRNLKVFAFDADLIQDDALGHAVTDDEGRFRIDYSSEHFRRTIAPMISFENKGPDLYFRLETEDGRLLIDEGKDAAARPGRKNSPAAVWTELKVSG